MPSSAPLSPPPPIGRWTTLYSYLWLTGQQRFHLLRSGWPPVTYPDVCSLIYWLPFLHSSASFSLLPFSFLSKHCRSVTVGCHAQLNLKPSATFILFECTCTSYYLFKSSIHLACSNYYYQNLGICSVGVIQCHALATLMYLADVCHILFFLL
jgi:hypothetical protein